MTSRIPLWIDLRHVPLNKRLPYLHAVEEMAAERVLLEKGDPHLGRPGLATVSVDGKQVLKEGKRQVGRLIVLKDGDSQAAAMKAKGIVVAQAQDWAIIPLENLIAARRDKPGTLYALAQSPEQAGLFAETLEVGVHGIVLAPKSAQAIFDCDGVLRARYRGPGPKPGQFAGLTIREAVLAEQDVEVLESTDPLPPRKGPKPRMIGTPPAPVRSATAVVRPSPVVARPTPPKAAAPTSRPSAAPVKPAAKPGSSARPAKGEDPETANAFLVPARIESIEDAGLADRVCVDATSLFRDGEGLLIGSTSRGFVLVQAETAKNPYVEPRPFRVNAGAVHSYLYNPDGRTKYLSELASGQPVLAVHPDGVHRVLQIGRCKVERRPHVLVRWSSPAGLGMAVLQNAETVRVTAPDGHGVPVTDLKPGMQVLVHHESAARHFGMPVDESLEER